MKIQALIVGGGQAGLAMSYVLKRVGVDHLVLERGEIANSWITQRWNSFSLVTQNWQNQLPGFPYCGIKPEGFLRNSEVIAYLRDYQKTYQLPVRVNSEVLWLSKFGHAYQVTTQQETFFSEMVVIATGNLNRPRIPISSKEIAPEIYQIHSSSYKSPNEIPEGAVLVVGGGQSGYQIAYELLKNGRKVFMSFGRTTWIPRNYRGKDISVWLTLMGVIDTPINRIQTKFMLNSASSPIISTEHDCLRNLVKMGLTPLGRLTDASMENLSFADSLEKSFQESDFHLFQTLKLVDQYITRNGILDSPIEQVSTMLDRRLNLPRIKKINLLESNISSIIWATGFQNDFQFVKLPGFDSSIALDCNKVSSIFPGIYFLGMHGVCTIKSGSLYGVGSDAESIYKRMINEMQSYSGIQ